MGTSVFIWILRKNILRKFKLSLNTLVSDETLLHTLLVWKWGVVIFYQVDVVILCNLPQWPSKCDYDFFYWRSTSCRWPIKLVIHVTFYFNFTAAVVVILTILPVYTSIRVRTTTTFPTCIRCPVNACSAVVDLWFVQMHGVTEKL